MGEGSTENQKSENGSHHASSAAAVGNHAKALERPAAKK
jgi:hypothetical protein